MEGDWNGRNVTGKRGGRNKSTDIEGEELRRVQERPVAKDCEQVIGFT